MANIGIRAPVFVLLLVFCVPAALQASSVDLLLDDGVPENGIGVNSSEYSYQWMWFNRFTPESWQFPITLSRISVIFGYTGVSAGDAVELVVYQDANGAPPDDAVYIASYSVQIQVADQFSWNDYDLPAPLVLAGPGDVLIGVINRYVASGVSPPSYPAALDTSASSSRSWVTWWTTDPPEPPLSIVGNSAFDLIDNLGFPGNWAIRAHGDFCEDRDGDGFGSPADLLCPHPETDCDDNHRTVYPRAPEICDELDNQCPGDPGYGLTDERCGRWVLAPILGLLLPQPPSPVSPSTSSPTP